MSLNYLMISSMISIWNTNTTTSSNKISHISIKSLEESNISIFFQLLKQLVKDLQKKRDKAENELSMLFT